MSKIFQKLSEVITDQVMIEIAKNAEDAAASGHALAIFKTGRDVIFALYHAKEFQEFCIEVDKQPNHLPLLMKLEAVTYDFPPPITGYFRITKDDCGWVVANSAAINKYGPLMYDIALSYVGNQGLIPDRESVSDDARKIWRYYQTRRKNEINIRPLNDCAVWGFDDDSWLLDVRYSLKNPNIGLVKNLTQQNEKIQQTIHSTMTNKTNINEILRIISSWFFEQLYHS
jgi:hypothetical protein